MAPVGEELLSAFDPSNRADPHPLYHRLRREAPRYLDPERGDWILTRYSDCEGVLRDPRWSSNPAHLANPPALEDSSVRESMAHTDTAVLLFMDPPDHTRIRNLISRNFTPRAVGRWQSRIDEVVDAKLDEVALRGEIELVGEYGFQIPVVVICEMLGVPTEDRDLFGPWSSDASRLLDGDIDEETTQRGLLGASQLLDYLNPLIEDRRTNPRDDLLSQLVHARYEDHTLEEDELRSVTLLLFVAGHETTMNLIGNGMKALLDHPAELARLRDDPSLIDTAVEEILRYDGPVHVSGRIPTEDIELDGQVFTKGCQVVTLLAAANRDPDEFPDPDRFDIGREPNHHLTFSKGIHHCLGASLARLEGRSAIGKLVERFDRIDLTTPDPEYRDHFVLRGLKELRVEVG